MRPGLWIGAAALVGGVIACVANNSPLGVNLMVGGAVVAYVTRKKKPTVSQLQADAVRGLIGTRGVLVAYEGGHPSIATARDAVIRPTLRGIEIALLDGTVVEILRADIVGIKLERDVQQVGTGGGRDLKGAAVGYLVFGGLGAMVGSRSKDKITAIDQSRIVMTVNMRGLQMEVRFLGVGDTYARVVALLG